VLLCIQNKGQSTERGYTMEDNNIRVEVDYETEVWTFYREGNDEGFEDFEP
jgi:cytochrome c-type biogenesis protein CcmE